jgi:hypothetical protein
MSPGERISHCFALGDLPKKWESNTNPNKEKKDE